MFVLQLTDYLLRRADLNMGQMVYRDNVLLSTVGDDLYKITSSEGELTFGMWDYVSMLGPYVEFHTYDSHPKIRCEFDRLSAAQNLYKNVKPRIYPEVSIRLLVKITSRYHNHEHFVSLTFLQIRFPLISTELVLCPTVEVCEITVGGYIGVELRNRFYIVSDIDNTINMIFSRNNFNVSSALTGGRVLIAVQMYDIDEQEMNMIKFILKFSDDDVARSFYDYVKQVPSCTNELIPVLLPDNITP